jgi:hypothetical protein
MHQRVLPGRQTAAVGVISALAQLLMTEAYRKGEPTLVAPFEYSGIVWTTLLGLLTLSIGRLSADPTCCQGPSKAAALAAGSDGKSGDAAAGDSIDAAIAADPLAADQVARLGGELFGRHLLAVEAAGVLLLVALVGSIAVVSRHGDPSGELAPARRAAS